MAKVLRIGKKRPTAWEEALEAFLRWKQAQGVRETTLEDYRYHVGKFFRRYPEAYDPEKLERCVYDYFSDRMKPATYNIRLEYLRAFFRWCAEQGIFGFNPLAAFKKRRDEGRTVFIEAEDLQRLLALPDTRTFAGLRDYALLLLTLDTGIRPKEAFSLLPQDVNLRGLEVYVRADFAKTKVSRTLPISPVTAEAIRKLLEARHPAWRETTPIFCTSEGTMLSRHTWEKRLRQYGERLGLKIRPYDLRHAFALHYLRNGGHALALQRTLGHTDLTMTKRYVALTQHDLREQHALATPVGKLLPQRARRRRVDR
jgi:site-specific recombinase XerD